MDLGGAVGYRSRSPNSVRTVAVPLLMQPPWDKTYRDKAHLNTAGDAQWSRWGGGAWAGIRGGGGTSWEAASCRAFFAPHEGQAPHWGGRSGVHK